jgi:maltooligosyltrehalose trehalohydrolase
LAAGTVLLSPYVPLLFMGEEYGETAPFLFFSDYQSPQLADAVREGRKREFAPFHWQGQVPDPQRIETYEKSKLNWQQRYSGRGEKVAGYYRALLELRKKHPIFQPQVERQITQVNIQDKVLFIQKQSGEAAAGIVAHCAGDSVGYDFPFEAGVYVKVLDSADFAWAGPGPLLPTLVVKGDSHMIGGFNLAVFVKDPAEDVAPLG